MNIYEENTINFWICNLHILAFDSRYNDLDYLDFTSRNSNNKMKIIFLNRVKMYTFHDPFIICISSDYAL